MARRGADGPRNVDASGDAPVLEGAVDVASIDTGDENRDAHLKAPDFFDAEQHRQITFRATATDGAVDGRVRLAGEITIKGTTKPIKLSGEIAENGPDPWGTQRIGLELEGTIDRREFDLAWNQTLSQRQPARGQRGHAADQCLGVKSDA